MARARLAQTNVSGHRSSSGERENALFVEKRLKPVRSVPTVPTRVNRYFACDSIRSIDLSGESAFAASSSASSAGETSAITVAPCR
jgi:hypothetical protein